MRSRRHLFSLVAVLAVSGAACSGGGSDSSVASQGGAGSTGTSGQASAAGGSSTGSSSNQGGSASSSAGISNGGISTSSGGTTSTAGTTSHSSSSGGPSAPGGTTSSGGTATGGTTILTNSGNGGTSASGGTTRSGGTTTGGTTGRTSTGYTPSCHNLGGMPSTGTFDMSPGDVGSSGGAADLGRTAGPNSGAGGTLARHAGTGGTTGTGDGSCTPEQLALRVASQYTILAWDDLPEDVRNFMSSFLPLSYIQEHIRFYVYSPLPAGATHGEVHLQIEYGCETVRGFIEWSGSCSDDRLQILYWHGPSQAWEVKVDRAEAIQRMTDAGCDTSNLALALSSDISEIPGALDCDGRERYTAESVVWSAGRQQTPCPSTVPSSRCTCYKAQCHLNIDTGALRTTPTSYSCPACH